MPTAAGFEWLWISISFAGVSSYSPNPAEPEPKGRRAGAGAATPGVRACPEYYEIRDRSSGAVRENEV